ncbi:MAG TPA: alkaline phosphatase family protein [Vicinamibacteria bacterium]
MPLKRAGTYALPLVFLLGGALLAQAMAGRAWSRFVHYHTPFAFAAEHAPAAGPPLVDRVLVVLVDGLTRQASQQMPYLATLRARGADLEGRAGQPSLSLPGRGVILSGAWCEIHGQTTNFDPRPLPVEHLFQLAQVHGRRTALAAGPSSHRLVAPYVTVPLVFTREDELPDMAALEAAHARRVEAAARLLREAHADLAMVELVITDEAGHGWGAASPQYARAVERADAGLRQLTEGIDLSRTVVLVTADHGHVARGGHGGGEPEVLALPVVLAGGPVRAGAHGRCAQVDLAPTLALLLGLPLPASSQGRPLLEHLALDPAAEQAARMAHAVQRQRFADRYAAWLEGVAVPPALAVLDADANGRLAEAEARQEEAASARLARDRRGRLPAAVLLFLALPLVLVAARAAGIADGDLAVALLAAGGGLAAYHALFPLLGLGYSFSLVNKDEELGFFFRKDMVLAVACLAAALAAAATWRRLRGAGPAGLGLLSLLVATGFTGLLWMRIGLVHAFQGVFAEWRLPDVPWAFAFYLDVLAALAVGFAAPALAGRAALGAHLAARRSARMVG